MKRRQLWLAIISALITTQQNTGEAATPAPNPGNEHAARVQASAADEEAVIALFNNLDYEQAIETAGKTWLRLENMPDKVLSCVAESSIRLGRVQTAKTGFEMLVARNPRNSGFRAGLAYTLLYAGEMEKGLAMYRQVLLDDNGMLPVAAEDAVALLSQGNITGGKALFEMAIAISPAKQHYRQWYESSLRLYGLMKDNPASHSVKVTMASQSPSLGKSDGARLHAQDSETARNGEYDRVLSRGMLSLQRQDYRQATLDLERARRLAPKGPGKAVRLREIEHGLATAYMHLGQNEKAASILAYYVQSLPVDGSVASDYIFALGASGQHELAVREGERLWPSYAEAPIAGLRTLAESYIRLGKQEKAIAVYRSLAERQPGDDATLRTLAFQLMLNGRTAEGCSYYAQILSKTPSSAVSAAADAAALLNTENYVAGKMLFELVLSKQSDIAYRKQYADVLTRKGHNRAAYRQYQLLSRQPEGELTGLTGMVRTSLAMGNYQDFRQALDAIIGKYGRSKAVAALQSGYEEWQSGDGETEATEINIDKIAAEQKTTLLKNNGDAAPKPGGMVNSAYSTQTAAEAPGDVTPETYRVLIDDLMQISDRGKKVDHKINIDGEIRYHYAFNDGSARLGRDSSGFRLYFGADAAISRDWRVYSMLEGHKSVLNYDNEFKLSRLYAVGKVGASTVRAGSFGYLMADGNIYDSGFDGIGIELGGPVKYKISFGETNDTKETIVMTAGYKDFDYNLEAGVYHYHLEDASRQNTIRTLGGNYLFNNFSLGAMYLDSSMQDSRGNSDGYVVSFNYRQLYAYRPGTYSIFAKYYNQARGTYIAHGMNGRGGSMQGFKGYGLGINYTFAQDYVGGIEYYGLKDKVTGEKGKTLWLQVTRYF